METKRIQDIQVGDVVTLPYNLGTRTVSAVHKNVTLCPHGEYGRPQITLSYVWQAWGHNWPMDTTETLRVYAEIL